MSPTLFYIFLHFRHTIPHISICYMFIPIWLSNTKVDCAILGFDRCDLLPCATVQRSKNWSADARCTCGPDLLTEMGRWGETCPGWGWRRGCFTVSFIWVICARAPPHIHHHHFKENCSVLCSVYRHLSQNFWLRLLLITADKTANEP